ncbi:MAG: glycosyltransferase family 2 protein [Bacteroidetes bacterium]|nr:glycosyltransferase family 2 protein [Bacteroidota bacterium]
MKGDPSGSAGLELSVVIFCYNEAHSIAEVIRSALRLTGEAAGGEVIVVDDGSTDQTPDVVRSIAGVRYICHEYNKGIGEALRTGYAAARCDYVCAVPGDGQFDLEELRAVEPFDFDRFYSFYRPVTDYTAYRRMLTLANKIFNRWVLGIDLRDVNWIKVYRKDQLSIAAPELRSSIVESEICYKLIKVGCRPVELPSVYHPRRGGTAKGGKWATLRKAVSEITALYKVARKGR